MQATPQPKGHSSSNFPDAHTDWATSHQHHQIRLEFILEVVFETRRRRGGIIKDSMIIEMSLAGAAFRCIENFLGKLDVQDPTKTWILCFNSCCTVDSLLTFNIISKMTFGIAMLLAWQCCSTLAVSWMTFWKQLAANVIFCVGCVFVELSV